MVSHYMDAVMCRNLQNKNDTIWK